MSFDEMAGDDKYWPIGIYLGELYHDLSYGEILSGQCGAWLVKNFFLSSYVCNQKTADKEVILKCKTIFRTGF